MRSVRQALRTGVALLVLAALWGCAAGTLPTVTSEPDRLAAARRAMSKREWTIATELLKTYVQNNVGSKDVDQGIYWLAECYLQAGDIDEAAAQAMRVLMLSTRVNSSRAKERIRLLRKRLAATPHARSVLELEELYRELEVLS